MVFLLLIISVEFLDAVSSRIWPELYRRLYLSVNTWRHFSFTWCQSWHDWSSNIWNLADRNVNFRAESLAPADISWLYQKKNHFRERRMHIGTGQGQFLWRSLQCPNVSAILCAELFARKFALPSAKLQMFDDQSCHVWYPIRACFGVTCSRLDASDGIGTPLTQTTLVLWNNWQSDWSVIQV